MDAILEFVGSSSPWWWIAIGLALITVEVATTSFFLMWPGLAAIAVGFAVWIWPELDGAEQLILFAALSAVVTLIGRAVFRSKDFLMRTDRPTLNNRQLQMIGKRVYAIGDFVNGQGVVSVQDGQWQARLENDGVASVKDGAALEIRDVQGSLLIVAES